MANTYEQDAMIYKALSDENRVHVLEMLRGGEVCACKLQEQLEIGQSTLSHHMKILCESGIVSARKDGRWTYYSINKGGSRKALHRLLELTTVREANKPAIATS